MGILRRAKERGKPLPERLEAALRSQAGLPADDAAPEGGTPFVFHIDQREKAIDLGDLAGCLMATPNRQRQTFVTRERPAYVASFSAGAGATAGSIAYSEDAAPALKAVQSGNMMPSVLCLGDQGGGRMDCGEDMSGTLRAQEHGHQPLVLYEDHGIDARYTGPCEMAPTVTAPYGTGGNDVPLVAHEDVPLVAHEDVPLVAHEDVPLVAREMDGPALFARQRVDRFEERETASTESARQHKDATDLVVRGGAPACLLIRRLTPLECERLQGFPDGWTGLPGASDAARYKALGNSVAVPCVEYLMGGIARAVEEGL